MNVCVMDHSAGTTCIEIQGPKSRRILQRIAELDVSDQGLPYYRFVNGKVAGIDCLVARLGVTGELGYEIFYDAGYAWTMYDAFVQAGKDDGLALCGNRTIGTFRLEKVYHVYTRDVDETTNPYEAGLGWTVKLDKGDFIGRKALAKVTETGAARTLVGFEIGDKPVNVAGKSPIRAGGKIRRPRHRGWIQPHAEEGNRPRIRVARGGRARQRIDPYVRFWDAVGPDRLRSRSSIRKGRESGCETRFRGEHRGLASVPATARSASVAFICPRAPVSCRPPAEHVRALERKPAPAE